MPFRNTDHMSRCGKCRYYCQTGSTFVFSHIGLCSLVFGYTVLGAFTFEALEAGNERSKKMQMREEKDQMIEQLWQLTLNPVLLNESVWAENATLMLKNFEMKLVKSMRKDGFDGNDDPENLQWTFSGALLYSIIVITTIGYGNIAPKTDTGKVVTILYAIVGIPLLLLCLSNIGDAMAHSFKFIYWKVCCYCCPSPPRAHNHHKKARSNRSSRFPSEARTIALQGDSFGPRMYSGHTDSFDRRGFMTTDSMSHSLPRNQSHTHYASREAEVADAYRVPIISNKYALHPMDNSPHPLQRFNPIDPMPYHPVVRPPTSNRLQEPSNFLVPNDELSFVDASSLSSEKEEDEETESSVPIMLCLAIVVSYICGGAILFSYWEGWDYSDSCYFCFITLTTIGFGDMVPGTAVLSEDAQLALGLCSLYLLFGMALLAMSFNLVQEEVTKTVRSIGKRIGILSDDDDDYDDM
ncbi:TWiK family of potassium channels protein 18-like [Argiope bruennichi]|uniref:TWiK family of potassium channels protein 18 like protein n=1 Tax=Argiope bruennichi TaxID=94029 RepID=A0A8T0E8L3_ARGBR|nr:TWiK family of potassium channels protein 18-like [Argiope bruennichi]KAF8766605.1 TWiK family of potassium channels protein 18 like protein [Argiope bruennichi]